MKSFAFTLFTVIFLLTVSVSAQTAPQTQTNRSETSSTAQTQPKDRPVVEYLNPGGGQNYPFSDAVRVGDWLILSGRIGTDSSGKLVPGGIQTETKQTMETIGAVLKANGASFDNVVKCTVMLTDMKEWPAMNAIYRTYFKPERMPARSALGVNGLALGARVEIECWAVVPNRR